ncbi:MAG: HEAT repeat domain-containing protein [Candidatus Latescibacterota bacterium]
MSAPPTEALKLRRLPWVVAHNAANSAFSQLTFFGPVFILFLDDLGLPKTRIGLLLSFLPFAGLLALFLAQVVASGSPDLGPAAAWALGRSGAAGGVPALRAALASGYPLLRAQAARSLGGMGVRDSAAPIHALLRTEADPGLRAAYAAALGQLGYAEAAPDLLACLRQSPPGPSRAEVALAVARLVDMEAGFVGTWRRLERGPGTALAQEAERLTRLCRRLGRRHEAWLRPRLQQVWERFAGGDLEEGAAALAGVAAALPEERVPALPALVLHEAAQGLQIWGAGRLEYALLALLGLRAVLAGTKP